MLPEKVLARLVSWSSPPLVLLSPALLTSIEKLLAEMTLEEKVSMTRDPAGVVIAPEVTARKGDGETYQPSFTAPLYSGTEFDLLEQRPDWWYIELEDGARCWIPSWGGELVLQ